MRTLAAGAAAGLALLASVCANMQRTDTMQESPALADLKAVSRPSSDT